MRRGVHRLRGAGAAGRDVLRSRVVIAFTEAGGGAWTVLEGAVGLDLLLSLPGADHRAARVTFDASRCPARLNGRYSASGLATSSLPDGDRGGVSFFQVVRGVASRTGRNRNAGSIPAHLTIYCPSRRVVGSTARHDLSPCVGTGTHNGCAGDLVAMFGPVSAIGVTSPLGAEGHSSSARGTSGAQGDPATGAVLPSCITARELSFYTPGPASCRDECGAHP